MPKQKMQRGFSLVEILLSLLFIGAIVTVLFTTTGSLFTRRGSNLQSIAAKIATKEIEKLRGMSHTALTQYGTGTRDCTSEPPGEKTDTPDPLDKDSGVVFTRTTTVSCFAPDPASPTTYADEADIVNINVLITWYPEGDTGNINHRRELVMDTIISASGL